MRRALRMVRDVLLAAAAAGTLAACTSSRPQAPDPAAPPVLGALVPREPPAVSAEAVRALDEARRLAGLGRRGDAYRGLEAALDGDAGPSLEGERLLQDLAAGTRGDAWIKRRAETRHDRRPDDADAAYLRGRIEASRAAQSRRFEEALALDPGHPYARVGRAAALERSGRSAEADAELWRSAMEAPWLALPWMHLGSAAFTRGAPAAAAALFREAAARGPADPRPWLALAACAEESGRDADAARACVEAVRRAPGDPAVLGLAGRVLARCGDDAARRDALALADAARAECGDPAALEGFRGRMLVALARWEEACAAFDAARAHGATAGEVAVPLRRAHAGAGRFADAVEDWLAALPAPAGAEGDERAPAWADLRAAASAGAASPANALRLAAAFESVGWFSEAGDLLRAGRARWPDDAALRDRDAALAAFTGFLDEAARAMRALRLAERRGVPASLDDALAEFRRISLARLGTDVTEGVVRDGFAFLGEFTVSGNSAGPFRDEFLRRGLLVVAGARNGRGPEVLVGRLVARRCGVRAESGGVPVEYDEHWIETEGLPEGLVGRQGGVAGLTLGRFVLLQLDVARRGPPREDPALPFLPRAATHEVTLRTLDTPSEVASRIERALAAEGVLERAAFDAVICHERVHVRDAATYLPVWAHPFASLALAWEHGFSGSAVESTLEARAAVGALADAAEPRAALAALLAFLPAEEGETAHVAGYRAVIVRMVDLVLSDPASFPEIDPRWNVVQQLDRLRPEQIRALASQLGD